MYTRAHYTHRYTRSDSLRLSEVESLSLALCPWDKILQHPSPHLSRFLPLYKQHGVKFAKVSMGITVVSSANPF